MQTRALEALVGFFVCIGIAAVFIMTLRIAGQDALGSNAKTYTVTAKFDNIGQMHTGAAVKLSGVKIGRVGVISIDHQSFQAQVSLEISDAYSDIPTDSVAKIQTAGILGEQYVAIDAGGADESLKNGDQIKLTQSAFVLENIIGQVLVSMTQKKDPEQPDAPAAAPAAAPAPAAPPVKDKK